MSANKLYPLIVLLCLLGFIYLFFNFQHTENAFEVCILKRITTVPCPSCGTTRAVILLLRGEIIASLLMNPLGIIVALMMVLFPVWICIDVISKRQTFYNFYKKTETVIVKKWPAAILIFLVLINWIWNIYKNI